MGLPVRIIIGIALAIFSTGAARTFFEISYRLGFNPERWLADLTMGLLSNDLAFWIILTALAAVVWIGLELGVRRLTRINPRRRALIVINNEGVALLNEGNHATQVGAWTFKFSDWHRRHLEAAAAYSPELRNRLEPIKRFTVPPETVAVNDDSHAINVRIVAEVMSRVDVWLSNQAMSGHSNRTNREAAPVAEMLASPTPSTGSQESTSSAQYVKDIRIKLERDPKAFEARCHFHVRAKAVGSYKRLRVVADCSDSHPILGLTNYPRILLGEFSETFPEQPLSTIAATAIGTKIWRGNTIDDQFLFHQGFDWLRVVITIFESDALLQRYVFLVRPRHTPSSAHAHADGLFQVVTRDIVDRELGDR